MSSAHFFGVSSILILTIPSTLSMPLFPQMPPFSVIALSFFHQFSVKEHLFALYLALLLHVHKVLESIKCHCHHCIDEEASSPVPEVFVKDVLRIALS